MGRILRARRVATAALYGGGGLSVAGVLTAGLIVGQINYAWRTIKPPKHPAPPCDGRYSGHLSGEPLRLVVLGDSSAAGLGVSESTQTPGAILAVNLARLVGRPVELSCFAVVGARSADLPRQVEKALVVRPDLALIMIGANDVTHRVWPGNAVRHLAKAVLALRTVGTEVIVGTCPDLGTVQPIQPPLRWVARHWSRQLAAAQTIAVVEAGGRTVSLGDLLGPEFARAPDHLFSADRFHPSAAGYAAVAAAVLPTVVAALDPGRPDRTDPGGPTDVGVPVRRSGVGSLSWVAVEAAYHAGTEVTSTETAGVTQGPGVRWAWLRQWVRGRAIRTGPTVVRPAASHASGRL